jgi:hypothetical protein
MTEHNTKKIIKEFHGESKYPSGGTAQIKIELFDDGQLVQTEADGCVYSTVTFDKKYKSLSYAKRKLNRLRDKYLGHTLLSRARAEGGKYD